MANEDASPDANLRTKPRKLRRLTGARASNEIFSTLDDPETIDAIDVSFGTISSLQPLTRATSLATLNICGTRVSSLAPLANLHSLRDLRLGNTSVADLTPLSNLRRLRRLYLWDTLVVDLTPLSGLTELEILDLGHTRVSSIAPLAGLMAMRSLVVNNTSISSIFPVASMRLLEHLDISGTKVSNLAALRNKTALRALDFSHTGVIDLAPLRNLSGLVDAAEAHWHAGLIFRNCPLVDEVLRGLAALKNPERTRRTIAYLNAAGERAQESEIDTYFAAISEAIAEGRQPNFGTPDEMAMREQVAAGLATLRDERVAFENAAAMMGHNQPPEPILGPEDTAMEANPDRTETAFEDIDIKVTTQLALSNPNLQTLLSAADDLNAMKRLLEQRQSVWHKAGEKMVVTAAEEVGRGIGKAINLTLLTAVCSVLALLLRWILVALLSS